MPAEQQRQHVDGTLCEAAHRAAIRRDGSRCLVTTYADPEHVRLPDGWVWADEQETS